MRPSPILATFATCGLLLIAACTPPDSDPAAPSQPAPTATTDLPASVSTGFRCGDLLLGTDFDNVAGSVTLSWSGHRRVLPQAVSASGARYADAQGNTFWNKGDEATLTFAGGEPLQCTETDEVSPWDEARARGVVFRAIGTEPGWFAEVAGGETSALHAQLDYGERTLHVERLRRTADGAGFSGTAGDGSAVSLRVTEGDCSDGMSDQTYPARAELEVGGQALSGCGAFLDR